MLNFPDQPSPERRVRELEAENKRLREALQPFATFADASSFDRLPDNMPMTNGSAMARRQVTAADFKLARTALNGGPNA